LICFPADMFACGDPRDYACNFVNVGRRKLQITQSYSWRVPAGLMCTKESLVSEWVIEQVSAKAESVE
jgi:hypothetical protein